MPPSMVSIQLTSFLSKSNCCILIVKPHLMQAVSRLDMVEQSLNINIYLFTNYLFI